MPGTIDKFQIKKTLGTGMTCKVKLGVDSDTGDNVAVKIIRDDLDAKTKQSVMEEIKVM